MSLIPPPDPVTPARPQWWHLPNRLALDSPAVVVLWTWGTGRVLGAPLPAPVAIGLFLTTWCIYLADRLLDVARCPDWSQVPGRLHFGRRHRRLLRGCLAASASTVLALLVSADLPEGVVRRSLLVLPGLILYLLLFVAPPEAGRKLPGKEFVIGVFCALPAWVAFGPHPHLPGLSLAFALLVTLNCLVIASRERDLDQRIDPGAATRWWPGLDRALPWMGGALALGAMIASGWLARDYFLAVSLAAAALVLIHRLAGRYSSDTVRVLADGCLLAPWPVLALA